MTTVEIDYLDGEISVQESEENTMQELTQLLGSEGAVIDEVTSNLRYRNKYPRVYKKASKELETLLAREKTGERTLKDGTVKAILQSEMEHLRACWKADSARTSETITRIAQAEPLYVKGERTGGGGKVSQAATDAANGFFAQGMDVVEEKVSIIEAQVPSYKVGRDADGDVTAESLARGIQALNKHLMKQAQAAALSALGTPAAA
jgi:hypothetical protein